MEDEIQASATEILAKFPQLVNMRRSRSVADPFVIALTSRASRGRSTTTSRDRPLTGSWSKGRNGHYAYYHTQCQCRAVNVSKAALEGAFVDELALLQPTPGYMRLVKDRILHVWEQRRADANERTTEQERGVKTVQQKLDRLDEALLYSESIDLTSYSRQRDKLREELTPAKIEHHPKRSMNSM